MSNYNLIFRLVSIVSLTLLLLVTCVTGSAQSVVWVADQGNGSYKNPVLYADYSDPDVCRAGNDYYLVSSSFNCIPGLQILHSNDLVNWSIIGYALNRLEPAEIFAKPQHGNGVWAPSIRYHKGMFYIYYGDPDYGIYMTKTKTVAGPWDHPVLVKAGKGLIDACPLWDDNGEMYLVHAFAGSRAGIKSLLAITRLSADGTKTIGNSRIVYDGHANDPTIEGPKFYKYNGYYYILAPAGGVATGWQVALRSKNVFGPYERKIVMAQGATAVNGPHQGAWVETPAGEHWFLHFQDLGVYGRVVHLQPMTWKNAWPVIGIDREGNGCGEPVLSYKKPKMGKIYPPVTPAENDEFNTSNLGLQWQWHANPQDWWAYLNMSEGCLRLYTVPVPVDYRNLYDVPNLLLQKWPAPEFTFTCKLLFRPNEQIQGESVGLVVMGLDYARLSLTSEKNEWTLSQGNCKAADKGNVEVIVESVAVKTNTVFYLRVKIAEKGQCTFSYSADNKKFTKIGAVFTAKEGKWIGAKVGLFATRPIANNDGGHVAVDWVHITKNNPEDL